MCAFLSMWLELFIPRLPTSQTLLHVFPFTAFPMTEKRTTCTVAWSSLENAQADEKGTSGILDCVSYTEHYYVTSLVKKTNI